MLRLHTLGGVYVADADGEPLTGAAGQRRLLALLSALAVAGDTGLSRDKLVGLLWPEADEERARHSLTQALYAARRALGVDDLFSISGDIRLNRARLTSDVRDYEAALAAGELERAVSLYQGPFLDGFFLPGSTEFEQWAALHRAQLEEPAVAALDRLAEQAESEGDLRAAVGWRRRLAAVRPLDSAAAAKLMLALAQSGDRAGALQHARLHEILLREQLGLDPDPAIIALAERMRDPAAWMAPLPESRGEVATVQPHDVVGPAEVAPSAPVAEPVVVPADGPEPAMGPAASTVETNPAWAAGRRRLAGWLLAVVVVAIGGAIMSLRTGARTATPATEELRQRVVVAPFRVTGASASLAYLRDGMVELLSARLADDSVARTVDAGAVLGAWRAAGLAGRVDVARDTIVRLAARLGAERVVIGSVVGSPSRVIVNAAVVAVSTGVTAVEASVDGPADSLATLVDRLTAKLLVQEAGEDVSLAGQTTTSLRALRAYIDGQAAFRRSDHTEALRQYERALQLDSTFALAALQLVRSAERLHTMEDQDRALALAWRYRGALSERDQALLVALAGPRFPGPPLAAEQLEAWERLVELTPDRADAWYELGARLFHDGATLGLSTARQRAAAALRRARALDPGHTSARTLLTQLAAGAPPEPTAGALPEDGALGDSAGPLAPFLRWRVALARGDATALRRLRDTMALLGPANLRAIVQASQFDVVALDDARRALGTLRERRGRLVERLESVEADQALASNEGRLRDARAATDRLQELQPGTRAHLRLRVLDALYGDGGAATATAAAAELQRAVSAPPAPQPARRAVQLADGCVLAQWRLSRADTAGVRRVVDALRAERGPYDRPPIAAGPLACAEVLDATLAVVLRRPDARAAVDRLDSLGFTSAAAGDASTYAPLLVARLYERLGEPARALAAIRKRPYMVGWPRYLATTLREEGRYAALAGQRELAAFAYARFLILRADPDVELEAQADSVRQSAAALDGASDGAGR